MFPLAVQAQSKLTVLPLSDAKTSPVIAQNGMPPVPNLPTPQDRVPNAQDVLRNQNLDDITNDPQQLKTWLCRSGSQQIAVEIKEIAFWNQLTEANKNWKCTQTIPTIPDKTRSFSCEPTDTMGLISVYWLKGDQGKETMKGWMNTLANQYNMVCTRTQTNSFWE
ncbi:MAG: hypothetical protein VKJ02_14235 [Snowella sp.]|nr:hypothetical protein [Snowella sp.]